MCKSESRFIIKLCVKTTKFLNLTNNNMLLYQWLMTVLSAGTFGVCLYQSHIIMFHLKMSLSLYAAVSRSLGSVQDQLTAAVQSATDTALKDGIASILHTKVPFHSQIIFLRATKGKHYTRQHGCFKKQLQQLKYTMGPGISGNLLPGPTIPILVEVAATFAEVAGCLKHRYAPC